MQSHMTCLLSSLPWLAGRNLLTTPSECPPMNRLLLTADRYARLKDCRRETAMVLELNTSNSNQ